MDRWDVLMVVVAAYVAVVSLVRLMAASPRRAVAKIRDEIAKQQRRRSRRNEPPTMKRTGPRQPRSIAVRIRSHVTPRSSTSKPSAAR